MLLAHRMVREDALGETLALAHGTEFFAAGSLVPDVRLIDALGPAFCLREGLLPLHRAGAEAVVGDRAPRRLRRRSATGSPRR